MNIKTVYLIVIVSCLLLCVIPPVNAANSVNLSWNRTLDYCVTALDTNSQGTLIFVGLGNGTILAYDNLGNVSWAYATNSSSPSDIKEIVSDTSGNLVWSNMANQTGYISSTGTIAGIVDGTGANITDIAISGDGGTYATTELNPPRITVRTSNGTIIVQNTSYGNVSTIPTRWTALGYDPSKSWLVTANESSGTLYFWNFTVWTGWEEFNPTHTVGKNSKQIFLDTFPYRQNLNITGTGSIGLIFHNTTNTTYIQRLNNSYFEYNSINTGKYFYWTMTGNLSNNQSNQYTNITNQSLGYPCNDTTLCTMGLLNLSWFNTSNNNYYVVLHNRNITNYTIYFGNKTYNNSIVTTSNWQTNGTQYTTIFTSSTTWTPIRITNISLFMVGGGGAGGCSGAGVHSGVYGNGGAAGTVGSQVTYASVTVTSGTTYSISIGEGGHQNVNYYGNCDTGGSDPGGTTSAFSLSVSGGTTGASGVYGGHWDCGAPGMWGGPGVAGYVTGGAPSSTAGSSPSGYCVGYNGAGATGYGSSGGGPSGDYGQMLAYPGGNGAPGYARASYYIYDIPLYYLGTTPTSSLMDPIQNILTTTGMNQTSSKAYVGTILGLSVPRSGGIMSIITDTIFYQQYMTSTGFGLTYCATLSSGYPALFAGTPHSVSTSNSGSASVESRGAYCNIYDAGGVAKASILTGGDIRSSDSAMTSGTIAAFGGDDGKLYILSREGSTTWYTYYTGTADTQINDVSVSWDGTAVTVGRFDGKLEYYITNYNATVNGTTGGGGSTGGGVVVVPPSVTVYVFKDGAPYPNQPITIYTSETQTNFVPIKILYTDGLGKITNETVVGNYYKFVVNNIPGTQSGDAEQTWQSNDAATTVYMYILTPSTPYEWNAYYNQVENNVTVVYSDSVTPSSVTVTITDLKTNLQVVSQTYTATQSFTYNYHDLTGMGSYQVNILINRLGSQTRDQRMITSSKTFGITMPVDIYIVYALSTLFLMIMAGLFSYANSRRGAFAVVIVAVILMYFGLLPWTMITVAMLAAIFAVMSLFASRVQ